MSKFVEVTISSDRGSPDSAILSSTINSFPTVSVTTHVDEALVTPAISSAILDTAAQDQIAMFEPRTSPDGTLSITAGDSSLEFLGFVTRPSHTVGVSVGSGYSLDHAASILLGYNASIYDAKSEFRANSSVSDISIAARVLKLLENRLDAWNGEGRIRGSEEDEALKDAIHEQNQAIYPKLEELLNNSTSSTEFEGLADLKEHSGINSGINQAITNVLFGGALNVWDSLMAICQEWQCFYAPASDSGMGSIRKYATLLEDLEGKDLAAKSVNFLVGRKSILPVTQVLVRGILSTEFRSPENTDLRLRGVTPKVVASYPSSFAGGSVASLALPQFLQGPPAVTEGPSGTNGSGSDYESQKDRIVQDLGDLMSAAAKSFVKDWAKNAFVDLSLGSSTANIICEFDLSWEVGKNYSVTTTTDDGSVTMFEGLLKSATHTLNGDSKALDAKSVLNFSHVRLPGFSLPE